MLHKTLHCTYSTDLIGITACIAITEKVKLKLDNITEEKCLRVFTVHQAVSLETIDMYCTAVHV